MATQYFSSIQKATEQIVYALQKNDISTVTFILDSIKNGIAGSAVEFHNAAVDCARIDDFNIACTIVELGLLSFPRDTDLLADMIQYGSKCRPLDFIYSKYYQSLLQIPQKYWTWRAFTFSFDFLMLYLKYATTPKMEDKINAEIQNIILSFKSAFPYDERAYVAESEYCELQRDYVGQIRALENGINSTPLHGQCALKYADLMFAEGKYESAITLAEMAADVREEQPSISLGYVYYILAMSREAVFRKNAKENKNYKNSNRNSDDDKKPIAIQLKPIYDAYWIANNNMKEEGSRKLLQSQIRKRVSALERETGIQSHFEDHDNDTNLIMQKLINAYSKNQLND